MTTSSDTELKQLLEPICRRMKQRTAVLNAWHGLTVAGALSIVLGLYGIFAASLLPLAASLLLILVVPTIAALLPMMSKSDWRQAARLVDRHYGLKDRTATALELAQRPEQLPIHQMQLRDAMRHLQRVEAKAVVPLAMPRNLVSIAGLLALALCLNLWPAVFPSGNDTRRETIQPLVGKANATIPPPTMTQEVARASQQHVRPYSDSAFKELSKPSLLGSRQIVDAYFRSSPIVKTGD